MDTIKIDSKNRYVIVVQGKIEYSWLEYFGVEEVETGKIENTLEQSMISIITDQAGLIGLLRKIHAIGVRIVSIQMH